MPCEIYRAAAAMLGIESGFDTAIQVKIDGFLSDSQRRQLWDGKVTPKQLAEWVEETQRQRAEAEAEKKRIKEANELMEKMEEQKLTERNRQLEMIQLVTRLKKLHEA